MPFELTPKQQEAVRILGGPQRHTMLVGGARSGKTFLLVRAILVRALRIPESRHAILRFRFNAVKRSIRMDTLPKVAKLCFPDLDLEYNEQMGFARLPNKSEIWYGGLDEKERTENILGQEYVTIYFNECSQIPYASISLALSRLAQKCTGLVGRAYYDLNPVGTGHWTYRMFVEKRQPASLEALSTPNDYVYTYLNPTDNVSNIDPEYLRSLQELPERQRARFLEGRYVAQLDGALWTLETIEKSRVSKEDLPELRRIVVAVDPSGARGESDVKADEIGIVAVGMDQAGEMYVLADRTGLYSPEQWGKVAVETYREFKADRIVGEKNFGGDMVRAVIHGADSKVPYSEITASRGKALRAEPIAAEYERGRVHHVGRFPKLEDEMTNFTTIGYMGSGSPNRADAMVHAASELIGKGPAPKVFAPISLMREGADVEVEYAFERPSPWRI